MPKSDWILPKMGGMGVYNDVLGHDRMAQTRQQSRSGMGTIIR